jgi:hypothetical protein
MAELDRGIIEAIHKMAATVGMLPPERRIYAIQNSMEAKFNAAQARTYGDNHTADLFTQAATKFREIAEN